ncbi:uncharacterized protein LOC142981569 [Anticarsia gemmatalis]|uniref:uncharacterized protein LOC142981569 n=1 Tax=Anticarsia gemmatalis TaxID=129554 RepID=UPI003F765A7F
MVRILLIFMVGASMVVGDPIKETCTEEIGQFGEKIQICRRVGVISKDGGRSKTFVNTTRTIITGPGDNINLHVRTNTVTKNNGLLRTVTTVVDKVKDKFNQIKERFEETVSGKDINEEDLYSSIEVDSDESAERGSRNKNNNRGKTQPDNKARKTPVFNRRKDDEDFVRVPKRDVEQGEE